MKGLSWTWSHGSWVYNYLCNQCLLSLKLWIWIPFIARCNRYNIMWFYPGKPVYSTNKTDHHDITDILLKGAYNNISATPSPPKKPPTKQNKKLESIIQHKYIDIYTYIWNSYIQYLSSYFILFWTCYVIVVITVTGTLTTCKHCNGSDNVHRWYYPLFPLIISLYMFFSMVSLYMICLTDNNIRSTGTRCVRKKKTI